MSLDDFLKQIDLNDPFNSALTNHERLPVQPPRYKDTITPLPQNIVDALEHSGIKKLYSHQAKAIDLLRTGNNIVVITPTASGKSLIYNLPVLEKLSICNDAHALYIFPLKALEQDQAVKLRGLIKAAGLSARLQPQGEEAENDRSPHLADGPVSVGIYDGDTPRDERAGMRKSPPSVLITNPDMLHLSILSYHDSWEDFLRGLKYIILDELHVYRGIFGSHILHVLHRLDRLCRYYGTSPTYIATSATIAEAGELAEELTGRPFEVIEESGAPVSKRHFLFFNPQESYLTFALKLFAASLSAGLKTIVFTKARRTTELLHRWMTEAYPDVSQKVSSYRAGFLVEERREIEQKLLNGELKGVISTSALELGIDIGGLDVCIMVGYPGTIATTWQRAGRVGRGSLPSCICLVAGQDQLDQYFMRNPSDFFRRSVEKAVVDRSNEHIARPHLLCAAQEVPITTEDPIYKDPHSKSMIDQLVSEGKLLLGASGDRYFAAQRRPQRNVNVRSAGDIVSIEVQDGKGQLGTISGRSVFAECHPGAIYLHRAEQYIVTDLDLQAKRVKVRKTNVSHYTTPMFEKETEILEEYKSKLIPAPSTVPEGEIKGWGRVTLARLKVTEQLVGYQKRRVHGQQLISQHELDYPPTSYETIGLAIAIPEGIARLSVDEEYHFRGGIHGVEHALLALSPMFALCDRNDMGGYSTVSHHQTGEPAVFLYDGHPGGIGLSVRLFDIFEELTERTLKLVSECPCETGCPSCIHSPKCGHGNIPLDKDAAILTLEVLTGKRKLPKPRPVKRKLTMKTDPTISQPVKGDEEHHKEEIASVPVPEAWLENRSGVVFDLETQRSAEEVGGWNNIKAMGLAWGVVYRFPQDEWLDFSEKDVEALIETLKDADLVIGFNQIRFDYEVLRGYSGFDFRLLPSYDMLVEVQKSLGHRLKLDSLASATLGMGKSADGLQSLQWWKDGEIEKVAKYCRKDVEVTRDLFYHILEKEYLLFEKKGIGLVRVPLKFRD
ncbi:DUF1998 domain-containing protein [bacterium]|nr:DUF1998 domain-containing protein [bacterium]